MRGIRSLWHHGWGRFSRQAALAIHPTAAAFEDYRLRPLPMRAADLPPSLNVLIPGVEPRLIYGGVATRFIATDWDCGAATRRRFEHFLRERHLDHAALMARVSVVDGGGREPFEVGRADRFLATAWWTALRLQRFRRAAGVAERPFFYLVQDFEPAFSPWSYEYARALESYGLEAEILFNSRYLHDYFVEQGLLGRPALAVLNPSIDGQRFFPPSAARLRARAGLPRRILVYGRPAVPRNLFACAMLALDRWIEDNGLKADHVRIVSAGEPHPPVRCAGDITVESVGKVPAYLYPGFLRGFDIGLSLMLSPHPSYPPLEMAMSGVVCVTNRFGPKDLSALSGNVVSCDPTPESAAAALARAWARAEDIDARIAESRFPLALGEDIDVVAQRIAEAFATGTAHDPLSQARR
jgi:hypothetical protein